MKRPTLNELTLTEKIGQILMPNQYTVLQKCEVSETTPRTQEEIDAFMSKYQYGSLWGTGNMMLKNANMAEINIGFKTPAAEYKEWLEKLQKMCVSRCLSVLTVRTVQEEWFLTEQIPRHRFQSVRQTMRSLHLSLPQQWHER